MIRVQIEKSIADEIAEMQAPCKPLMESCRHADAAWQRSVGLFVWHILLGVFGCLPLVQRVFIQPKVVAQYQKRAISMALTGAGFLALYAVGGLLALHDWSLGYVSGAGIALVAFGGVAFGLSLAHLAIATRHPDKCAEGGFGLANAYCLFSGARPNRLWTWLQDGVVVLFALGWVLSIPAGERAIPGALILTGAACILGPVWWSGSTENSAEQ